MQQESRRQLRLAQPVRGLSKADRGKIQERHRGKSRKVAHGRVQGADQPARSQQVAIRFLGITLQLPRQVSRIAMLMR